MTIDSGRNGADDRMPVAAAIEVLTARRSDEQIVITCMGSSREWPRQCDHALDLHHVPSSMGATVPLAIGLALAQPKREVLVLCGDGSLLMNLGTLVTAVAAGAANLTVALVDNGVYEITGGQKTAGNAANVDFAGLARAAGFANVSHFRRLDDWRDRSQQVLCERGPRFIWLEVAPEREDFLINLPRPFHEQLARFRAALGG